jgi:hypothetical protein
MKEFKAEAVKLTLSSASVLSTAKGLEVRAPILQSGVKSGRIFLEGIVMKYAFIKENRPYFAAQL